jgi:hypothetical protein
VLAVLLFVPFPLDGLAALRNIDRLTWHDRTARTVVVETRGSPIGSRRREEQGAIRGKFGSKSEAAEAGGERAKRDETEHNRDGQGSRNSYGRDAPRTRC